MPSGPGLSFGRIAIYAVAPMSRILVLAVVLAAVLASSVAAAPTSFYEANRLEPAASSVAGKHARIWCATSAAGFRAAAAEATGNADATGFATPGQTDAYLHPLVCAYLLAWLNGRHPEDYSFAASALVLAHESIHLRGVTDEAVTDCAALAKLPAMIRKFFPPGKRETVAELAMLAQDAHDRRPSQYQGDC